MDHSTHLAMSHDPTLVVISWAVAILAASAALTTLDLLRSTSRHRAAWLLGGATTFGLGTWAMHFIAMRAMSLGMAVQYDLPITALSVVFSIFGAWLSFNLITRGRPNFGRILVSGTFLGAGIGAMHYTGMAALQTNAALGYNLGLVGASVGVAVTIASLGLWLMTSRRLQNVRGRSLIVAAVVGSAIPLMHYAGMAAARFSAEAGGAPLGLGTSTTTLLNFLLVGSVVVLSFPLFFRGLFQAPGDLSAELPKEA